MKRNEELAYEKVKRAIMLKRLNPGQRVTEEWISKELNMSRTPIRAAFKRLENEGFLISKPHRGAFVYDPTDKEIEDVFKLRVVIEKYAATEALELVTDEDIQYMEELLQKERTAYEEKNYEDFLEINRQFHTYPAEMTSNVFLLKDVERLHQWSDCYLILKDEFYTTPLEEVKSLPEHREIVDAFIARDSTRLENAIQAHLMSTLHDLANRTSIFN
nr:GntR family transcriptional regulator [Pontibacillus halophilus]